MKSKCMKIKSGLFTFFVLVSSLVHGQVCSPDTTYTQDGIWPAPPSAMDNGCVGVPYSFHFTINVPTDTVIGGQSCTIDSVVITGITPLPAGLSYQCNPNGCRFPGGSSGCIEVGGIPSNPGTTGGITINTNIHLNHPMLGSVIAPQSFGSYSIQIGEGPSTITSTTPSGCGASTGQASVIATPPGNYQYLWSPGGSTNDTIFNVSAGMYIVTVTDTIGCSTMDTAIVTNPGAPSITSVVVTDPLCFGSSDGSATVSTTGGSGGNSYSWSPSGPNAATNSNLTAGNYAVTVTDNSGCSTTTAFTLENPPALTGTTTSTPTSCYTCSDGSAGISASGGTGSYTYNWLPTGGNASTASGLPVGTYTVTVTDANGCTFSTTVWVNSPANISNNQTDQWNVYPNPASNVLMVTLDKESTTTINIFDISGRLIYTRVSSAIMEVIDISTFDAGTYLVKIDQMKSQKTFKIIKQ